MRAMLALEKAFLIGVEGTTEIWLVRHGDCYRDLRDADDPPLSALGREQAERLAGRVRRAEPVAVWSSPYRRALETARAIGDDVRVDQRLIEMPLVIGVVDDIVTQHAGGRVVVVSHAASILACLTDALHLEAGRLRVFPYYTSVSIVRVLGDTRMVGTIGDVAHLE
jgi:broad specificity phosphatase PhoE